MSNNKAIVDQLKSFVTTKLNTDNVSLSRWVLQVSAFLTTAMGVNESDYFSDLGKTHDLYNQYALRIGHLQGLIARLEAEDTSTINYKDHLHNHIKSPINTRKVFIVHGHNNEAKESTARFLEKLSLQVIILHEQPNSGRTIIEKFENYSEDVGFAIILLTPDDIGGINSEPHALKFRARQNVILELGYFMGRLGRTNVCALYKGEIELPTDYQGVIYIEMDDHGAWKTKLAQELVQAKLPIDLNGLIEGKL